jgi:hypothetical protein
MSSKYLILSVTTLVFLSLATSASATVAERIQVRRENIAEFQATAAAKKAERVELRQEARSDVAEKHATRLEQHFNGYYTRLSAIILKMETRINSITGKDTTTAKSKLAEAKTKLEEAKILGAKAVSLFRAINPAKWSEQKAQAITARDTAESARIAFKATHALMVEAVVSLKSVNSK